MEQFLYFLTGMIAGTVFNGALRATAQGLVTGLHYGKAKKKR